MVINVEHLHDLERWAPAYHNPMLMLGSQILVFPGYGREECPRWFADKFDVHDYTTLDLDGGDLQLNLNDDLTELSEKYATVVNYGTVEHCWDIHVAFCNVLRAVKIGGFFLSHGPAGGWLDIDGRMDHGVHVTLPGALMVFVEKNGFEIEDQWFTQFRNRGQIFWLSARKVAHIDKLVDFELPLQAYVSGKRPVAL
jgi:hypothetical protein